MVSVSVRYLFCQPIDEKIKTWPLRFLAKENPNIEKVLFDWSIVLQYDVKAQSHARFYQFVNQANRSISVCLLFLLCSRVFISRSCENRSDTTL